MLKCGRVVAALLLTLPAIAADLAAQAPPKPVLQADNHWSAWQAPTSQPEGAKVYRIEKGDTLWALAERFYGDPYRWPQLWEQNRYIEDSHWIYPGDPLVMDMAAAPIEEVANLADASAGGAYGPNGGASGADEGFRLDRSQAPPEALGSENDLYCSGFIGPDDQGFERRIVGSEYENLAPRLSSNRSGVKGRFGTIDTVKMGLSNGDIVYVDGGAAAGLTPGSVFTVVTPKEKVQHPVTGREVGRFYSYSGRLRILSVQAETAIAEIVHGCDRIFVGATLQSFEDEPIPLARRAPLRPVNDPASAETLEDAPAIVRSMDNIVSLGQGHVVFIDQGADHDIAPGDVYTIYRLNAPGLPTVVIGELGILSVRAETATAKILESRYAVHLGDHLDLELR